MKSFPALVLLLLGLCLALGGCSTTNKPDSIVVTVADLKAVDLAAQETRVTLTLRFTSESVNAFAFSSSIHKLYVNGSYLGRATSSTPIGMPPLSTVTKDVILVLDNAAALKQLVALSNSSVARYRLESVLIATSGEDEVRFKGNTEGTVDLRGLR